MTVTRRNFIKSSTILAAGVAMPAWSKTSANDQVNVALIGCRSRGWGVLSSFLSHPEVRCVALADVDQSILSSRSEELEKKQSLKADVYGDYRKILERKDVDIVIIGTPDHWHCLQFVDACKAGKDVYVEKPLSNSIAECDVMVAAARRYNRIVQVGQQQRSSGHWKEMVQYLRSGKLGNIGHVHIWANFNYAAMQPPVPDSKAPDGVDFETWLGAAPARTFNQQRFHGSWRMFWDYGGGLMTDWGVHLLDMGLWGMDVKTVPIRTSAFGGKCICPDGAHETFDTQMVTYHFDKFVMTWENNAGTETGPYGKNYGLCFRGANGTLVANRDNWEIYPEKDTRTGAAKTPEMTVKADFQDQKLHVANFLECVTTRNSQTACTVENGSLCAKYAHLGNIAARTGKSLSYDDSRKKFDNSEADKYIQPVYRAPWKFPVIS